MMAKQPAGVVAFGELLLRLDAPGHERFVQAESFVARYTGGEANVAAALSQWGVNTRAVSRVPDHEIGQACVNYACVKDPCAPGTCAQGLACADGACFGM